MEFKSYIKNADCFDEFKNIKDKTVDLVCVDLPYGQTKCEWDCVIDLSKMWDELKRICKDNCVYIFFCTTKFGHSLISSNPKWFRYDLVWEKTNSVGFLNANKMPLRNHEMIYIFYKNLPTYNPQKIPLAKPNIIKRNEEFNGVYGNIKQNFTSEYTDRHPVSIQKFKNSNHKSKHSTQKPVEACEWLIKSYSNEGDSVLDFTMGSGSTGVACKNTNRKFIGIELNEEFFKVAEERIKN